MALDNSSRSAISKALTTAAGKGDLSGVDFILKEAENQGFLREETLLRAGLRTAARRGQALVLQAIIAKAQQLNLLGEDGNTLRLALQDASKLGHLSAAIELLKAGAKTDVPDDIEGSTCLYWAVTQPITSGHLEITEILLSRDYPHCPADTEWRDKEYYTPLISAATKGHSHSVAILLKHGANVNAKDKGGRHILHIVAAAPTSAKYKWDDATADVVLAAPIDVDAKDAQGRCALHWAASTSKRAIIRQLLNRRGHKAADPNLRTSRGKTALHLSCAGPVNESIVDMLLSAGADPNAMSDGGWSCLHYAASVMGGYQIIRRLLKASPALLNATTSTGATALHVAAQSGELKAVELLLSYPECKTHLVDSYDCTPLLRAASGQFADIVRVLAPHNNPDRLSQFAIDACKGFDATIVDLRTKSEHKVLVQKRPVHDVIFGKDAEGFSIITTSVNKLKQPPDLRWVHLPHNNIAWVKALLTKAFIEDGATDVEAYRTMEKVLYRQQHRARHPFMRPQCERCPRRTGGETPSFPVYDRPKADYASSPERLSRFGGRLASQPNTPSVPENRAARPREDVAEKDDSGSSPAAAAMPKSKNTNRFRRTNKSRKTPSLASPGLEDTPTTAGAASPATRVASFPISDISLESAEPKEMGGSNVCFFMPYLHYETDRGRREMQEAAKRQKETHPGYHTPSCPDEALVHGYLGSSTGLHLRRTLDQFWLHGVDTVNRDEDQVVGRWCRARGVEERIFMVDQLWIVVLGSKLVLTSFPQRWQQPKRDDPLDLVEGIIQDASQPSSVSSVYDFVALITARAAGAFDRHVSSTELKFLDMFEASIGSIADSETKLYSQFYKASKSVHEWLKDGTLGARETGLMISSGSRRYPAIIDEFLDIGSETGLLQEVKDIRDELAMLAMVLTQQKTTIPQLYDALAADFPSSRATSRPLRDLKHKFDDQKKLVASHLAELKRMTDLAEVIETSLLNLLDLKQKQANAFEARFARDQAAGTVRQGQIIMVFTMVTIVFLPMSFLATFFDIPIAEFARDGAGDMRLGYVSQYTFGIGLAISVALILIAFSINPMAEVARKMKLTGGGGHAKSRSGSWSSSGGSGTGEKAGQMYSLGRFSQDMRKSMDERTVREVSGSPSMTYRARRRSNTLHV
jgi:ankyrin repeat protein/Mg2+ and Co2+ transporter CorA